jgi:hypothetical protein
VHGPGVLSDPAGISRSGARRKEPGAFTMVNVLDDRDTRVLNRDAFRATLKTLSSKADRVAYMSSQGLYFTAKEIAVLTMSEQGSHESTGYATYESSGAGDDNPFLAGAAI